jgi:hypothetical protein
MIHSLVRLVNAGFKAPAHANPRDMAKEWKRALVGITDHELDVCITHIIQNKTFWPMPVEILEAYDDLGFAYQQRVRRETQIMESAQNSSETEEIPF